MPYRTSDRQPYCGEMAGRSRGRPSALEPGLEILVGEPEVGNRLGERFPAREPAEEHVPPEPRPIEHDAHGQQALVVRNLRFESVEPREAALERAQWNRPPGSGKTPPRRRRIGPLEILGEPLVQ